MSLLLLERSRSFGITSAVEYKPSLIHKKNLVQKKGVTVMRRLHTGVVSALALVMGLSAAQADAQSLRGFRAEGQAGYSQFSSEGNHKSKFGWGGAVGVDAYVANSFVLGAEGAFWWADAENHTHDGAGIADHKTFEEWSLSARAGVMV